MSVALDWSMLHFIGLKYACEGGRSKTIKIMKNERMEKMQSDI